MIVLIRLKFGSWIVLFFCLFNVGRRVESDFKLPILADTLKLDLVLTVPYSVILPSFRRRRHIGASDVFDNNDKSSFYQEADKKGIGFERLQSAFSEMGLKDLDCQKRLLCMVSQNPNKYSPLTEFIAYFLDPRDHVAVINNEILTSRFDQFYEDGHKWFYPRTNCGQETILCSSNPDKIINWNVLRTFQFIKHFINVRLKY